jgi:hypothetical protein
MNNTGNDKNKKIIMEIGEVDAMVLLSTISSSIEDLAKQGSLDAICKLILLQGIGRKILDQVIPPEEQEQLLRNSTLLQALKREKDAQGKDNEE